VTRGDWRVQAVLRVLRAHGHTIDIHKHLPRRGIAEQRSFVRAGAGEYFLSWTTTILEPDVVERMLIAIQEEGCGLLAAPLLGLAILMMSAPMSRKSSFGIGQLSGNG